MTFKLAQFCYPYYRWLVHTDNATLWYSKTAYIFNSIRSKLPELVLVHEHPEPPGIKRDLMAITDGHIDVHPGHFATNWDRYQLADFSATIQFADVIIFSRKLARKSVFEGIFDPISLLMIILTILALWGLLWITQKRCSAYPEPFLLLMLLSIGS